MANPHFNNLLRLGKQTYETPRHLTIWEEQGDSLVCPRGFADRAYQISRDHGEDVTIIDDRRELPLVPLWI
ncbi:MAG: hypothetical protein GY737_14515 [Desulfobacteraceae bacterium]|nr:hypothetical protein [Desulfobacteraceae bacterium]